MNSRNIVFIILLSFLSVACKKEDEVTLSGLNIRNFQTEVNGQLTNLFVLKNENGMEACVTNYGARLVSLMVPDRNGKPEDVICGFSNIQYYLNDKQNFGAIIGRYSGGIHNATFTLDSITHRLSPNSGLPGADGGDSGFACRIWQGEQLEENAVQMTLFSLDGEYGFPGNLGVTVIYRLTDQNELDVTYEATTDKATVINLSNQIYFDLSGDSDSTLEDQTLYINADSYIPYDSLKCITGELLPVFGTPFDFMSEKPISKRIDEDVMQLTVTNSYNHYWVLNTNGDQTKLAARLRDKKNGRELDVYTNEPGLRVYVANGLNGDMVKKGNTYQKRSAICLEVLHFPDSPNKPQFPSTVLRPEEVYRSHCIYRFR